MSTANGSGSATPSSTAADKEKSSPKKNRPTSATNLSIVRRSTSSNSSLSSLSQSAAALLSSYVDSIPSVNGTSTSIGIGIPPMTLSSRQTSAPTASVTSRASKPPTGKTPRTPRTDGSGQPTPRVTSSTTSSRIRSRSSGNSTPKTSHSRTQSDVKSEASEMNGTEHGDGEEDLHSAGDMTLPIHIPSAPVSQPKSGTHTPRQTSDGVSGDIFAMRRQVEDARSQYDWMAKAYKKREKEWKTSSATIKALKDKISSLQTIIDQQVELPKRMLEEAEREIVSLTEQLATANAAHEELSHTFNDVEARVTMLTEQDATAQAYIQTLTTRLNESNELEVQGRAERLSLLEAKSSVETNFEIFKRETEQRNKEWTEKEAQLTSTIASLESQLASLQQQLATANATIIQHQQAHAATQATLTTEQSQHKATQSTLHDTQSKLSSTENILTKIRDELRETQEKLANEQKQHATTREELSKTKDALQKEQKEHTATRDTHTQTAATLKSEQTAHQQTQQMLTSIKQQLVTTQQSLNTIQSQYAQEASAHATTRSSLEQHQSQLSSTQTLLKSSQDQYKTLSIQYEQQQTEFIQERSELEKQFAAFREESAVIQRALMKTNDELTKSVEEAKDKFNKYAALLESRNKESQEVQAEADRQVRELKEDITHLHENLSILSHTCHDMSQSFRSAEASAKATAKKGPKTTLTKEQTERKKQDEENSSIAQTKLEEALLQIKKTETHLENQKRQWTEKEYVYEKRQQYWQEHSQNMQGNMAQLLEQIENLENRCLQLAAQLMERQKAAQMTENEEIKELESKIKTLEQTLEGAQKSLKTTETSLKSTSEKLATISTAHTQLTSQHTALETEHKQHVAACVQHTNELETLQKQAVETKAVIETTQEQLSTLRAQHSEQKMTSEHDITTLSQQLVQTQHELASLRRVAEQRAKLVAEAQTKLKVIKPYVGIELASTQNRILKVTPSSPAHHGGLAKGDIIISINEVKSSDIGTVLKKHAKPGNEMKIIAMRGDQQITCVVETSSKTLSYSQLQRLQRIASDVVGSDDANFLASIK